MPRLPSIVSRIDLSTVEEAEILARIIKDVGLVCFDTETTGKDKYRDKIVLMSYTLGDVKWRPEWGPKLWDIRTSTGFTVAANTPALLVIAKSLEAEGVSVVTHNYSYDAHIVYRNLKIVPGMRGKIYDTIAMDHLLDENRSGRHSLDSCTTDYDLYYQKTSFGKTFKSPRGSKLSDSEWALVNETDKFKTYAALDTCATYELFRTLRAALLGHVWKEDKNLWDFYLDIEEPYIRSIWSMESNGVQVDTGMIEGYSDPIKDQMSDISNYYAKKTGQVFNFNSSAQVSTMMAVLEVDPIAWGKPDKDGKKNPSWNKEVLSELELDHPEEIRPLMIYRKLSKLLSQYVDGLTPLIDVNGRLYGSFNVTGTVTGRLSSSGPNLQNIVNPSEVPEIEHYDIRRAFVSRPGHKLIVADYDQLEIKILAHISGDETLIAAINNEEDLHSRTAANMFGLDYEEVVSANEADNPTPEQFKLQKMRKAAKTILFGILYGMGEQRLAKTLKISLEESKEYIDRIYQAYPKVSVAKDYFETFCEINGYVPTILKRQRRIPEIWSTAFGSKSRAQRQLFNSVIQGSAADLMRWYMPKLTEHPRLKEIGALVVFQVHDEVGVESPDDYVDEVKSIVEEVMESAFPEVEWKIPLTVTARAATNWSEAK